MKANELTRVYEVYNRNTDIDLAVTSDLMTALHVCGELVDDEDDIFHDVYVYNNITVDQYYNDSHVGMKCDHYDVKDFIAKFSIFESDDPVKEVLNKEVYHNMDPEEQLEVLRYIPDVVLIDELARRIREYRSATDAAAEALDMMKIFV